MGNEIARCRMEGPLKDILKANGTPLKTKTARSFLREVGEVAPWFIEEGLLNVPQWEHLGEDLKRCPFVTSGTLAVWSLVRVCLQSTREPLKQAVQQGGEVLEQVKEESHKGSSQDSDSESESSEGLSDSELQEIGEREADKKEKSPSLQALQDLEAIRQQFESKEVELQKALEELRMQGEVMAQLKAEAEAAAVAQIGPTWPERF
ncbi:endogenous retrovirus group K member 5 Gag polyprotein-like [Mustela lutreola]|uniref:endogenous retrovirus group K member 5 Gag polyprotein-like n=1 Tax=Mustela lutreola TaxID=9666 RepID=UPI0027972B1B|nr:endogenous retrovirus group K member 5 Gag polyprotein-like [Mustela lutreola]